MIGLMWFDNSKDDLVTRVKRVVERYRMKSAEASVYAAAPNVCYVHAGQFASVPATVDGIAVVETHDVLPNHFWVGVRNEGH